MTVEEKWEFYAVFIASGQQRVAKAAFFAGYSEALAATGDPQGAQRVMDELREGKCG